MQIIQGVRSLVAPFKSSVLTIGNFDGVHLGHRALVETVVKRAKEVGIPSIVMTFEPHPVKVLYPDRKLHRIFELEDQIQQMASLDVDTLVIEPFSREFSQLQPERYLTEWIYRPFVPETVVVGYDFSFGANRQGSIDFLKEHSKNFGFRVEVVAPVKVGDVLVSSTRIRQALEVGDVELAAKLLGRDFYLRGLVEKGAGRGRSIGIPTANLRTHAETIPARGVYAGWAKVHGKTYPCAVNIGLNPTFHESLSQSQSIEAHILDFGSFEDPKTNIYGEELEISFVARIRDEMKFAGVKELTSQIALDITKCLRLLSVQTGEKS